VNYGFWAFGTTCGLLGAASTIEELADGRLLTVKDPDFPAVVETAFIVNALRTSRQARNDFNRLFPTLDQVSQERLLDILATHKYACGLEIDQQALADQTQHAQTISGVRTRTPSP
jgi:hypothetical protein